MSEFDFAFGLVAHDLQCGWDDVRSVRVTLRASRWRERHLDDTAAPRARQRPLTQCEPGLGYGERLFRLRQAREQPGGGGVIEWTCLRARDGVGFGAA
ncbi:hypothetical protein A6B34_02400 [Mycolicibacterium monacense]|nr:hypothetical protein A6B34_02400 [Mycolicibacterium monacense]